MITQNSWVAIAIVFFAVMVAVINTNAGQFLTDWLDDSSIVAQRQGGNFISGDGVNVSGADNSSSNRVDFTLSATVATTGTLENTQSFSGLQVTSNGTSLLLGCSSDQIPKWDATDVRWECQADETGAGGGDPVLVNTTAITDGSGVDLTDGTGITITLDTGPSPDTATFAADLGTAIVTGEITDDTILEVDLDAVDSASDEECLTFESGAGGDFEWQSCSSVVDTGPSPDCSGTTTYQDGEGNCDTLDAGTDITADLEEEAHCAEHDSADVDCSAEALVFAPDELEFTEIAYGVTMASNPNFLVDECFFRAESTGGGFICEGSTANSNEQLYLFPDVDGLDTTSRIVVDNTEVTNIDGDGLTITSGVLDVDLGTAIVTGEITDDTILEADLDAVDSAADEECLTFESGAGGDFEWQSCAAGSTAVDVQSQDTSIATTADTMDFSAGFLVSEGPANEANITLQVTGATVADDFAWVGNSSNIATATSIGDCDDSSGNHLNYDTGTNAFSCGTSSSVTDTGPSPDCSGTNVFQDGEANCDTILVFQTITDGTTNIVADALADTVTISTSGSAVSTIFNSSTDTMTLVVDPQDLFDQQTAVFIQADDVSTTMAIEDIRMYNTSGTEGTIQDVTCAVDTAPTSSVVTVDVNMGSTTIFTTQGNRPSIAAGDNVDVSGAPDITAFPNLSYLDIDVDATDSGNTAADLSCFVRIRFRIFDSSS